MERIKRIRGNVFGNGTLGIQDVPGKVAIGYVPVPEGVVPTSTKPAIYFNHQSLETDKPVTIPQDVQ